MWVFKFLFHTWALIFPHWFEEDEDAKNEERRQKGAPVPRNSGDED